MQRFALLTGAALLATGIAVAGGSASSPAPNHPIQFVVTSDAHYGLTRASFRGHGRVDAHVVNAALVAGINALPTTRFPADGGLGAGLAIGALDFIVEGGDITNREQTTPDEETGDASIQAASVSWEQFRADYIDGLRVTNSAGAKAPLFLVPGNHESSNAVGHYQPMKPLTDPAPLIEIYNRMLRPAVPKTPATYDYQRDRVFYSRDLLGVHFVFLHVWPDSVMRDRIERDLANVSPSTPVVIFTHDQPDAEGKHFVNPNGAHDINATDRFENLLADRFQDGPSISLPSVMEQTALEQFLVRHPNITAYFHGNSNWHQVYDWNGPKHTARIHVVRVDSPMKGAVSKVDETKLSFAVVSLDPELRTMTVRERLWNADPAHPQSGIAWGDTTTVTLVPRPAALTP